MVARESLGIKYKIVVGLYWGPLVYGSYCMCVRVPFEGFAKRRHRDKGNYKRTRL